MRDALFHINKDEPATLQAQIREALVSAVVSGQLPAMEPIPSTRAMARRLNVSRNTVVLAYQALVEDGFLLSRERSGYYVNPDVFARHGVCHIAARREPGRRWRRLAVTPAHQPGWPDQHRQTDRLALLSLPLHLRPDGRGAVPNLRVARLHAPGHGHQVAGSVDRRPLQRRRPHADRTDPHAHSAAPRHHCPRRRNPDHHGRAERALSGVEPSGRDGHAGRHRRPRLFPTRATCLR